MSSKRVRIDYFSVGSIFISGLGMALVWLRQTNYGAGLESDALTYISIAENLAEGKGLVSWGGELLPDQLRYPGWTGAGASPLFPFALSIIISLGTFNTIAAAAYINMIAFGLSIWLLLKWLHTKIISRVIVTYIGIACAVSPVLGDAYANALTEPIFILTIMASLFSLDKFLNSDKEQWLILAAVFAALSWLTRYAGISVTISTLIFLVMRKHLPSEKVRHIVLYSTITLPVIGLSILWNYLRIGHLVQPASGPGFDLLTSVDTVSSEFFKWVFGVIGYNYLETLSKNSEISSLLIRVIVMIILTVFVGYKLIRLYHKAPMMSSRLATSFSFVLVYTFIILGALIYGDIASIEARFMAPIFVIILVIIAIVLDQILNIASGKLKFVIITGLACLWLTVTAISSYDQVKIWRNEGVGYSSKTWIDSETIGYLRSNPMDGLIYSNNIRAVYANMRVPNDTEVYYRELPLNWNDTPFYSGYQVDAVVWFHGWKPYIHTQYDFMMLIALSNLEIAAILEDGVVLEPSRRPTIFFRDETLEMVVMRSILKDARLVARGGFDIYADSTRIIYITTSCRHADIESQFFLHVYPADRFDIPENRRTLDFDNRDFQFNREGFSFGNHCAIIRNLPDYDIKSIRTGQYTTEEGELWYITYRPEVRQEIS